MKDVRRLKVRLETAKKRFINELYYIYILFIRKSRQRTRYAILKVSRYYNVSLFFIDTYIPVG